MGGIFPCSVSLVRGRDIGTGFMTGNIRQESVAAIRIFLAEEKLSLFPSSTGS